MCNSRCRRRDCPNRLWLLTLRPRLLSDYYSDCMSANELKGHTKRTVETRARRSKNCANPHNDVEKGSLLILFLFILFFSSCTLVLNKSGLIWFYKCNTMRILRKYVKMLFSKILQFFFSFLVQGKFFPPFAISS